MLHREIQPIEGYLLKDLKGTIFDVKGLVHPPDKLIAFPRFIPNLSGNHTDRGVKYEKIYTFIARFKYLEQNYPQYIIHDSVFDEKLCEVPVGDVAKYYNPLERLRELRHSTEIDGLGVLALEFFKNLKTSAQILWDKMGISGSILANLHRSTSDIDPVVYGTKNCCRVYEALKTLQQRVEPDLKTYSEKELRELFRFRFQDTRVSFKDFARTESRKILQGKFRGRDYFMRFVKDWEEIQEEYGSALYKNFGYARIKAKIEDASEAIFTPCTYRLKNVEVLEGNGSHSITWIASFRGRFCEQARIGEEIVAQGKVERVIDNRQNREYFRLLLGNKASDFMMLA